MTETEQHIAELSDFLVSDLCVNRAISLYRYLEFRRHELTYFQPPCFLPRMFITHSSNLGIVFSWSLRRKTGGAHVDAMWVEIKIAPAYNDIGRWLCEILTKTVDAACSWDTTETVNLNLSADQDKFDAVFRLMASFLAKGAQQEAAVPAESVGTGAETDSEGDKAPDEPPGISKADADADADADVAAGRIQSFDKLDEYRKCLHADEDLFGYRMVARLSAGLDGQPRMTCPLKRVTKEYMLENGEVFYR